MKDREMYKELAKSIIAFGSLIILGVMMAIIA